MEVFEERYRGTYRLETLSLEKASSSRAWAVDEFVDGSRVEWAPMTGEGRSSVVSLYRSGSGR